MRAFLATAIVFAVSGTVLAEEQTGKPVKILIVSGGCCHDYAQ